jgi:hypothetical protein
MILTAFRTVVFAGCIIAPVLAHAAEPPTISKSAAGGQLIVNGKPYLILGGELGNSSATFKAPTRRRAGLGGGR